MNFVNKSLVAGLTSLAIVGNARADLYDDFSSGILDSSKWEIRQDPEGQQLTQGFGIENGYFFAENSTDVSDRRTILSLVGHSFQPGEILSYEVNYQNGSGNRALAIYGNGGPLDRAAPIFWGGGSIGHNGQDFLAGNILGNYNVQLSFQQNGINIGISRPDQSTYEEFIPNTAWEYGGQQFILSAPYSMGFETWSNGSVRAEYDNFNIVPEPPTLIALGGLLTSLAARRRQII